MYTLIGLVLYISITFWVGRDRDFILDWLGLAVFIIIIFIQVLPSEYYDLLFGFILGMAIKISARRVAHLEIRNKK